MTIVFSDPNSKSEGIPKNVLDIAKTLEIDKSEGWSDLEKAHGDVGDIIGQLDQKLNKVLRKQEYEYLQAYNIYVKRKEKELRELIDALNVKNSNNNIKDQRITQLEITIDQMRQDAFAYERKLEALTRDIKTWKEKHKNELEEKDFFHKQALDAKRKNKLLKVAIGRLQVDKEKKMIEGDTNQKEKEKDTDTFLTGANIDDDDKIDSIENS